MSAILEDVTESSQNLTSEKLVHTHTASGEEHLMVQVRLSSLTASDATITTRLSIVSAGSVTLTNQSDIVSRTKWAAANSTYGVRELGPVVLKDGEKLRLYIQSSNASDTGVTVDILYIDINAQPPHNAPASTTLDLLDLEKMRDLGARLRAASSAVSRLYATMAKGEQSINFDEAPIGLPEDLNDLVAVMLGRTLTEITDFVGNYDLERYGYTVSLGGRARQASVVMGSANLEISFFDRFGVAAPILQYAQIGDLVTVEWYDGDLKSWARWENAEVVDISVDLSQIELDPGPAMAAAEVGPFGYLTDPSADYCGLLASPRVLDPTGGYWTLEFSTLAWTGSAYLSQTSGSPVTEVVHQAMTVFRARPNGGTVYRFEVVVVSAAGAVITASLGNATSEPQTVVGATRQTITLDVRAEEISGDAESLNAYVTFTDFPSGGQVHTIFATTALSGYQVSTLTLKASKEGV